MLPTREQADALLIEAEKCNPGPWGKHSRTVAHCAEKIALSCTGLDPEKAYILGLLHDIGRKFGKRHLGHVSDGYSYMMQPQGSALIIDALSSISLDEYDKLIQLCDSLAGAEGVLDIKERMSDVKRRYGAYPQEKWDYNLKLKEYFEKRTGQDIYLVTEKDTFRP